MRHLVGASVKESAARTSICVRLCVYVWITAQCGKHFCSFLNLRSAHCKLMNKWWNFCARSSVAQLNILFHTMFVAYFLGHSICTFCTYIRESKFELQLELLFLCVFIFCACLGKVLAQFMYQLGGRACSLLTNNQHYLHLFARTQPTGWQKRSPKSSCLAANL